MNSLIQDITLIGSETPWLNTLRQQGRNLFSLPTPKTESWKYTKLRELNDISFTLHPHEIKSSYNKEDRGFDCYQITFINGVFNPFDSILPEDIKVVPLIEFLIEDEGCTCHKEVAKKTAKNTIFNKGIDLSKYPFAALNTAYLEEGVYIHIEKNTKLDKPVFLLNHTQTDENILYNLRNLIHIGENSTVDFIEHYSHHGDIKSTYFSNHVTEINLSKGSVLNHYKLQTEAFYAYHIALTSIDAEESSIYNGFCLQKGAKIGRNETIIRLNGKNAKANVNAAYIMSGWATLDTTTDIIHLSPETYSNQNIKGVVGGDARGVFQGKIHIAKDAIKTEGKQLHKSLLLSNTAEVDCKPELEIFADDVKCSHGAASGELDEEQLFYLKSRGIGEDEAKQILIDAYFDELFSLIPNPDISSWLSSKI